MMDFHRLVHEIVREQDEHRGVDRCRSLVRRRLALVKFPNRKRRALSLQALALAASCVAISTAWALGWERAQPARVAATAGASSDSVATGAWLDAPESTSLPVHFADGTYVEVAPRAMLRVLELGTSAVRLALESGRIDVDVRHSKSRRWEWRAGAFIVRTTEARFSLGWEPSTDSLDLALYEGKVELIGCGFGDGHTLTAGKTVRASCRDGVVEVSSNVQQLR